VMLAVVLMLSKSADVVRKIHAYYKLRSDNELLTNENNQLRAVSQRVGRMDSLAAYLERISIAPGAAEAAVLRAEQKAAAQASSSAANWQEVPGGDTGKKAEGKPSVSPDLIADESIPNVLPVVDGWITQPFSDSSSSGEKTHPGIDIAATEGSLIKAPAAGTIIDVGTDKDYGNMFSIKHEHGFITRYGHCETVFVTKNQKVERGQTIARVGSTGHSTAPHLHYELIKDGRNRNPLDFVKAAK
jgi:murein DD-endopeptidase MepM/ murein hydrolase activator NlpD